MQVSEGQRERERERDRIPQGAERERRGPYLKRGTSSPNVGLKLTNREIMT